MGRIYAGDSGMDYSCMEFQTNFIATPQFVCLILNAGRERGKSTGSA
jgi:hypothetical protein